jgi:hypothetical protein
MEKAPEGAFSVSAWRLLLGLGGFEFGGLIGFAEVELDLFQQRGEHFFFLEAGIDVLSAIYWAVSGDDDDGNGGILCVDLAGKFKSVHAFHAEVGDQNVELFFGEFFEGVRGAVGAYGSVTLHFENLAAETSEDFMVVDKENGFHTAPVNEVAKDESYR